MGTIIPFEDPQNYRRIMQRVKGLVETGEVLIPPSARKVMEAEGLDEHDILNIIKTGFIQPHSHSRPKALWRYVVEGESIDHGRARCVIEVNGCIVVVTAYVVRMRQH